MSLFGDGLRKYRKSSTDPDTGKKLSQERLGELVGVELGMAGGYSGATVSYWENGISKIQADERSTLVSLVKVLYKLGGLKTITEANELLEAGDYRALSLAEKKQIFSQAIIDARENPPTNQKHQRLITLLQQVLDGILGEKIKARLVEAQEGPAPAWPRQVVALMNGVTTNWTVLRVLRLLGWSWVWTLSFWLIPPSLHWPFIDQEQVLVAMVMYGAGALVLPTFIGALTPTKDSSFWQDHPEAKHRNIRLYTHQGAGIGFFLAYMAILVINLIIYYIGHLLSLQPIKLLQIFLEAFEITFLVIISYGCARLVPYNLWKAFKRLDLADGGIFFIFIVVGPFWGLFFYAFHPVLLDPINGTFLLLSTLTLIALAEFRQYQLTGTTIIPAHWHALFYGSIAVVYEATISENWFNVVALAGMVITFSALSALGRIHYTVRGMIAFPIVLYISTLILQLNRWIGCIVLGIALWAWWRWGRNFLSFPRVFWVIVSALAGCFWLWQRQWLSDLLASVLFSMVTILLLLWERNSRIIPQR